MIYKFLLILLMPLLFSPTYAKAYGDYDIQKVSTVISENADTKQYRVNLVYLDQIIKDLSGHAQNYPPNFDSTEDQQRAIQDVKALSGIFDALMNTSSPNVEILLRAGVLHSVGHNLNIEGAANKAHTAFQTFLSINADHPQANFLYGVFLANSNNLKQALPYLEKSSNLGFINATYSTGIVYLALGNKEKALELFETYKQKVPAHKEKVDALIESIHNKSD